MFIHTIYVEAEVRNKKLLLGFLGWDYNLDIWHEWFRLRFNHRWYTTGVHRSSKRREMSESIIYWFDGIVNKRI